MTSLEMNKYHIEGNYNSAISKFDFDDITYTVNANIFTQESKQEMQKTVNYNSLKLIESKLVHTDIHALIHDLNLFKIDLNKEIANTANQELYTRLTNSHSDLSALYQRVIQSQFILAEHKKQINQYTSDLRDCKQVLTRQRDELQNRRNDLHCKDLLLTSYIHYKHLLIFYREIVEEVCTYTSIPFNMNAINDSFTLNLTLAYDATLISKMSGWIEKIWVIYFLNYIYIKSCLCTININKTEVEALIVAVDSQYLQLLRFITNVLFYYIYVPCILSHEFVSVKCKLVKLLAPILLMFMYYPDIEAYRAYFKIYITIPLVNLTFAPDSTSKLDSSFAIDKNDSVNSNSGIRSSSADKSIPLFKDLRNNINQYVLPFMSLIESCIINKVCAFSGPSNELISSFKIKSKQMQELYIGYYSIWTPLVEYLIQHTKYIFNLSQPDCLIQYYQILESIKNDIVATSHQDAECNMLFHHTSTRLLHSYFDLEAYVYVKQQCFKVEITEISKLGLELAQVSTSTGEKYSEFDSIFERCHFEFMNRCIQKSTSFFAPEQMVVNYMDMYLTFYIYDIIPIITKICIDATNHILTDLHLKKQQDMPPVFCAISHILSDYTTYLCYLHFLFESHLINQLGHIDAKEDLSHIKGEVMKDVQTHGVDAIIDVIATMFHHYLKSNSLVSVKSIRSKYWKTREKVPDVPSLFLNYLSILSSFKQYCQESQLLHIPIDISTKSMQLDRMSGLQSQVVSNDYFIYYHILNEISDKVCASAYESYKELSIEADKIHRLSSHNLAVEKSIDHSVLTDTDKIHIQIYIDVKHMLKEFEELGIDLSTVHYKELESLTIKGGALQS